VGQLLDSGSTSKGVLLTLVKKSTKDPTSLSRNEAVEKALCHGWIDGQSRTVDDKPTCSGIPLAAQRMSGLSEMSAEWRDLRQKTACRILVVRYLSLRSKMDGGKELTVGRPIWARCETCLIQRTKALRQLPPVTISIRDIGLRCTFASRHSKLRLDEESISGTISQNLNVVRLVSPAFLHLLYRSLVGSRVKEYPLKQTATPPTRA
jgi:hypothetical protein